MDEELQKRNTDCVYFLASPLTCKKGIECEYRHSETARLNPRDCWYWLAGSCFNPSCAFRHPPLDACIELSSESALPQYQCSLPTNKVNVPCYFYFNGFCTKGDRCSFLHGPDDGKAALKSLKTTCDAPQLENGPCAESDPGSTQIETDPKPIEAAKEAVEMQIKPKEGIHLSALGIVKDQSASPHLSASDYEEEAAAVRSDALLLGNGLIQRRFLVSSDQSSEEQVDGHIEREDWLDSSPGFDVLVDDASENLGYEDDPECLLTIDRDGKELNGHFLGYDYGGYVDYDPAYPDTGILYEQERLDSYDQFDNEEGFDYVGVVSGCSDPILPRKRKFFPVDLAIDGCRGVDLRSHLRKRRVIDGRQLTRFSRRNNSQIDRSLGSSQRRGRWRLRGRLTTEPNDNGLGSLGNNGSLLNGADSQGWFRDSRSDRYRSRQRYKEKRLHKQQFHPSEFSRKPIARKRPEEASTFIGPKTLAQIKEEKRKATGNGDSSGMLGHSSRTISEEFQGPKPLSEILKDKKKLGFVKDGNSDSS